MDDWDDIVGQFKGLVWGTAYRLVGNTEDAEDCVQDTFLAALNLSRRQRVENWPALLTRLCTCRALDRLRSRVRVEGRREFVSDWCSVASDDVGPAERTEAAELAARLRASLALIPARQAEVVCLHCLAGMPLRDIAVQLETKSAAVRQLLHRARSQLRRHLEAFLPKEQQR